MVRCLVWRMRHDKTIFKTPQDHLKEGIHTIPMHRIGLLPNEVSREATFSSLQHHMPDPVHLKHQNTGRISNGVVDITHPPKEKLIIKSKIGFQQRICSPLPQTLLSRFFQWMEKSISRELR